MGARRDLFIILVIMVVLSALTLTLFLKGWIEPSTDKEELKQIVLLPIPT